jgi:hypothetical protein
VGAIAHGTQLWAAGLGGYLAGVELIQNRHDYGAFLVLTSVSRSEESTERLQFEFPAQLGDTLRCDQASAGMPAATVWEPLFSYSVLNYPRLLARASTQPLVITVPFRSLQPRFERASNASEHPWRSAVGLGTAVNARGWF